MPCSPTRSRCPRTTWSARPTWSSPRAARQWAEAEADAQLGAANASLADVDLPADVRAELTAIAEFITARQW